MPPFYILGENGLFDEYVSSNKICEDNRILTFVEKLMFAELMEREAEAMLKGRPMFGCQGGSFGGMVKSALCGFVP